MKEPIVIRNSRKLRALLWVMTGVLFLLTVWGFFREAVYGILLGAVLIPSLIGLVAVESWYIELAEAGIRHGRYVHSYSQIRDIRLRYYQGERTEVVTVYFTDGQLLRFRMDCDGAPEAKRFLNKRHSIS